MKKYKAVFLDDDAGVREFVVDWLRVTDFETKVYSEAEQLLADLFFPGAPIEAMPDLLMLDMQLEKTKMTGIDLLDQLIERDVPTEILVVSGQTSSNDILEAIKMGAASGITKPFDNLYEVARKMELLAETGKRRRHFKMGFGRQDMDASRQARPVFLSYSSKDKQIANGIRRNLERRNVPVWYAPTTIEIGEDWISRIGDGIDKATIFLPVITDNYIESRPCLGELTRFYCRMERHETPNLTVLPILAGISEAGKRHSNISPIIDQYQYVDISIAERYIDRLTVLLGRIQMILDRESGDIQRKPATPPAQMAASQSGKIA
jgi:FixJ family two-component response regulator